MNRDAVLELIKSDAEKDLHIHSCFSDGSLMPEEIVKRWKKEGKTIIAITDHDEIEGSIAGCIAARENNLAFIPGIEFDSTNPLGRKVHILGYGMDYNSKELLNTISELRVMRGRRNDELYSALNALGYEITLDDIGEINEGRFVGKPTFGRILIKKGYVKDMTGAFDEVFNKFESIRNIVKETLSSKKIIDTVHKAGGVAVMAHPMEQKRRNESFDEFKPRLYEMLDRMLEYGIDGIECCHPSASQLQEGILLDYAREHELLVTGGSDFHGDDIVRDFTRYHE